MVSPQIDFAVLVSSPPFFGDTTILTSLLKAACQPQDRDETALVKCFVASAFDHRDVDAIYDRTVKRTLRRHGIQPLRVDRVEHNEDIDNQIFALLNDADFCIADLTYARPSVYYEAGYALGSKKPVIYICRKDHSVPKTDDPNGNLKVHFDLQMKNIIWWTGPNLTFEEKLARRIRVVIRPIIRRQRAESQVRDAERQFASLSIHGQLHSLVDDAGRLLRGLRFSEPAVIEGEYGQIDPFAFDSFRCTRTRGAVHQHLIVIVRERFNRNQLHDTGHPPHLSMQERERIRVETFVFRVSLNIIQRSAIRSALPYCGPIADNVFTCSSPTGTGMFDWGNKLSVSVIDGIKSLPQFEEQFRTALRTCGLIG